MDKISETWLNTLTESTRKVYVFYWKKFLTFTNKTGKQLLEEKKAEGNGKMKGKLFEFKQYLLTTKNAKTGKVLSENSAKTGINVVRGFFRHYETPLMLSNNERKRLKRAKRKTRDFQFTKGSLSKMAMVSNLTEKYILIVGKSLGLRASDFIRLTYGDFRAIDLNDIAPIPLGEFDTIKEGIMAYPYLDSDSIPIIKQLLDSNTDKQDNERVLPYRKTELTVILQRIGKRAKVSNGNLHVRFHGLRKFLIDRLSAYCSESQWKQIVGKTISESAYVSTTQLRKIYTRAMNDITISQPQEQAMNTEQLVKLFESLSGNQITLTVRLNQTDKTNT